VEALNRPELRLTDLLVPWIVIVGALGFLVAWLVVTIMEGTGLSRYVWHLPLFFLGLVVLFSSLIGMAVFP
jgi:predicted naringenin-chalcone synthase